MIDPIIFQFKLFNLQVVLRWYGVLVMFGADEVQWMTAGSGLLHNEFMTANFCQK